MIIVIALGGNALLQPNELPTAQHLRANIIKAIKPIAEVARAHHVLLVHGNGPQVGLLALQAEAYQAVPPYPLDLLDAESQGLIGSILQQALYNELPNHSIATLLTHVVVDAQDPAFLSPSKPIGPFYSRLQHQQLTAQHPDWTFQETQKGWRRVVASPMPKHVIELPVIQQLLSHRTLVIAGGGGGIPCIKQQKQMAGIEAVVDKDLTASLIAKSLNADRFIILTNVEGVYPRWPIQKEACINTISANALMAMSFQPGSMQPKVQAACQFVLSTQHEAAIGNLTDLQDILKYQRGTRIISG